MVRVGQHKLPRAQQEYIYRAIAIDLIIPKNHHVAVQVSENIEDSLQAYIINLTSMKPLNFGQMDLVSSSCQC